MKMIDKAMKWSLKFNFSKQIVVCVLMCASEVKYMAVSSWKIVVKDFPYHNISGGIRLLRGAMITDSDARNAESSVMHRWSAEQACRLASTQPRAAFPTALTHFRRKRWLLEEKIPEVWKMPVWLNRLVVIGLISTSLIELDSLFIVYLTNSVKPTGISKRERSINGCTMKWNIQLVLCIGCALTVRVST